jgi:RNA polymerase sigma-70 factor (ECF subfamily)
MLAIVADRAAGPGGNLRAAARASPAGERRACEVERFDEHGRWIDAPVPWDEGSLGVSLTTALEDAIAQLPCAERAVLTLRYVERLGADDTCAILDIAATTEKALLHAAGCRVRRIVEERFRRAAARRREDDP